MSAKKLLFNTRFLSSIFTAFKLSFPFRFWQNGQKSGYFRKAIIGCGMILSIGYVSTIEDETIRNLKLNLNR